MSARKIAPVYVVHTGEMLIHAPVRNTWPYLIDYPSWQKFRTVQHISGQPGQEGEVVLLRKEVPGFEFPPYNSRTIKMDPQRRVMWKHYSEPGAQEVGFFGIVDFGLVEAQQRTRFCYDLLYEFLVPYCVESELDTFRERQYANFATLISVVFPKLKQMAEGGGEVVTAPQC